MRYRIWWVTMEDDPILICEHRSKKSADFDFAHLTEPSRFEELKGRLPIGGELQYREHTLRRFIKSKPFANSVLLDHYPSVPAQVDLWVKE